MAYYLSAQGKSTPLLHTHIYFIFSNIFFHSYKSYEYMLILANLIYFSISNVNKISKHDRYQCEVMLCCQYYSAHVNFDTSKNLFRIVNLKQISFIINIITIILSISHKVYIDSQSM